MKILKTLMIVGVTLGTYSTYNYVTDHPIMAKMGAAFAYYYAKGWVMQDSLHQFGTLGAGIVQVVSLVWWLAVTDVNRNEKRQMSPWHLMKKTRRERGITLADGMWYTASLPALGIFLTARTGVRMVRGFFFTPIIPPKQGTA